MICVTRHYYSCRHKKRNQGKIILLVSQGNPQNKLKEALRSHTSSEKHRQKYKNDSVPGGQITWCLSVCVCEMLQNEILPIGSQTRAPSE